MEAMDVSPVYALAPSARASVVSVVSVIPSVASLSSLSSLEIDGSPVTQHNKVNAAIWNSYRNAYTPPSQTLLIIKNHSNIVVNNTDPPPPLPNLDSPTAQTTDGVMWSPTGGGVTELPPSALWQSSMTERTMTSPGWPGGLGRAVRQTSPLEIPEERTVTTWEPGPLQVGSEAGVNNSVYARRGDTSLPESPTGVREAGG